MWTASGLQRGRLQRDLDRGSELLQLARDIAERYDTPINVDELAVILGFVCVRHKISHVSLTEAGGI